MNVVGVLVGERVVASRIGLEDVQVAERTDHWDARFASFQDGLDTVEYLRSLHEDPVTGFQVGNTLHKFLRHAIGFQVVEHFPRRVRYVQHLQFTSVHVRQIAEDHYQDVIDAVRVPLFDIVGTGLGNVGVANVHRDGMNAQRLTGQLREQLEQSGTFGVLAHCRAQVGQAAETTRNPFIAFGSCRRFLVDGRAQFSYSTFG